MFHPAIDMVLFTIVFVLWIFVSYRTRKEIESIDESHWIVANEPKYFWLFVSIFGFWPVGLLIYMLKVRPKLMKSFYTEVEDVDTQEIRVVDSNSFKSNNKIYYKLATSEKVFDFEKSEPKYFDS